MRTRIAGCLVAVVWVALASFPGASRAAVTIGHTGGNNPNFCTNDRTFVQSSTAPGNPSYEVPAGGGVITAWSTQAYASTSSLRLKIYRKPNPYLVVGQSELRALTPNKLNTFPVSPGIRVAAGDRLGLATPPIVISGYEQSCWQGSSDGDSISHADNDDAPPGATKTMNGNHNFYRLNVAATVEPDADADGLGDESQDPCPTVAGTVCPGPKPVDPPADVTAPRLDNVFIKPTAFRVASKRSARSSASAGATFGYTLSEAASVRFTIERLSKGRRVKGKCVTPKRSNRRRKPCTRARPARQLRPPEQRRREQPALLRQARPKEAQAGPLPGHPRGGGRREQRLAPAARRLPSAQTKEKPATVAL